MPAEGNRTSTESRYAPCDPFIDEKSFRTSDAPKIRVAFGKDPELCVDKRSRGDRVSQGFLQWNRDVHDEVRDLCGS